MKKYFFTLFFLIMALCAQPALAKSYTVDSVNIEAVLQSDGSADVTETITMTFDGDFSRFVRDIPLSKDEFIEDLSVSENGVEYKRLDAFDPSRPAGSYATEEKGGKLVTEFYYKTKKETRSFVFSYVIENAIIVHNDIIELNRKFIDKGWDRIKKLDIKVYLPPEAKKGDIKVWSHGPLWGKAEISGNNEVHYQITVFPQDTFAELRIAAPLSLFPDATERQSGKEALTAIIAQEQKWADEANAKREQARKEQEELLRTQAFYNDTVFTLVALNCAGVLFLLKRRKNKNKPALSPQYYRDLPSDISPAELGELYSDGSSSSSSMKMSSSSSNHNSKSTNYIATILDLSVNNFIEIKNRALPGAKVRPEDIGISLNVQGKNTSRLLRHERTMLDFIKKATLGSPSGSMANIKDYTQKSADEAREILIAFGNEVTQSLKDKGYTDKMPEKRFSVPAWFFMISVAVAVVLAFISEDPVLMIVAFLHIFFCILVGVREMSELSRKGLDEMALWKGFKNFLRDFTLFKEKELPELVVWQKYLVYATVLGEAKNLLKQLPRIYSQMADADYMTRQNKLALLYVMQDEKSNFFEVFDSIGSEMTEAARVATSSDSSGSGGGGGSSGGDSGGSSGGGGRAD